MPNRVESAAHSGRPNRDQVFDARALPTHSWATEAGFELLAAAFHHATADHILALAQFLVLHPALVRLQVGRLLVQRSGLTIDKLSSMLLLLELNEFIQSAPGGRFVRI